jgi:arylsulfatase A-like enzyme
MTLLTVVWVAAWPAVGAAESPPNVLLIISDDQAWYDYGFLGHADICTPHLDRLASQSAVFTRGYVPHSLCRPSLATILTGLFPHQHKITANDPPPGVPREAMLKHIQAVPTLPRLLAERGYQCLQTGKWWEGHWRLGGFTHGMTHGDPARRGRHGDEGLRIGREGLQPIYDFIQECGQRPFFVWYAPMLPHTPHNPPQRILHRYQRPGRSAFVARYMAMCEWFDETCGELLKYLDDRGLAERTLVVYVTDNGWIQRDDGPQFAPKSKRSPYDGGLRTPIMLRWPGKIAPRRDDRTLVSSIDLAPTILAACGVRPPQGLPGVDLLEVCRGKPLQREAVFGAVFAHDAVDIDRPASNLQFRWCVHGDWKLIVPYESPGAAELYDVGRDPHEEHNLAGAQPQRVADLQRAIDAWWTPDAADP